LIAERDRLVSRDQCAALLVPALQFAEIQPSGATMKRTRATTSSVGLLMLLLAAGTAPGHSAASKW
jgi:hypothetical protein